MPKLKQVVIEEVMNGNSFLSEDGTIYVLHGLERYNQGQFIMQVSSKNFFRQRMIKRIVDIEEVHVLKEQPKIVAVNCYYNGKFVNEELIKAGYAQPKSKLLNSFNNKHTFSSLQELNKYIDEHSDMTINEKLCCASYQFALSEKQLQLFSDIKDITGKGTELDSFIKQYKNQTFNGFIDYIIDANKYICMVNINNMLYKFTGTFFGLQCINTPEVITQLKKEYLQLDMQITIVDNFNKSSLVSCIFEEVNQKSNKRYNINLEILEDGKGEIIQWIVKQNNKYSAQFKSFIKTQKTEEVVSRVQFGLHPGKTYNLEVFEVNSCEYLTFMLNDQLQRIYFASTITPRITQGYAEQYAIESLQILRKYYGCIVSVCIDYVRENEQGQRFYGTIYYNKQNIVIDLIKRGFFRVLPHKVADSNRSSAYIEMLAAEKESHGLKEEDDYTPQYKQGYDKSKQITIIDLSSLKLNEQKTRAALLSSKPQVVTIDQILDGGRMKCTLTNEQDDEIVYIKIQLLCCRVASYRRQELCGIEAFKFLKQFLYKNVEISFEGSVEKFSQAFFVHLKTEDPQTHQKIYLNQVMLEKGLASFSYNKQASKNSVSRLQNAAEKGRCNKQGIYQYDLDEINYDPGELNDHVKERVYGLNVNGRSLYIQFADEDEIDYQLKQNQKPLDYYEVGQLVLAKKGEYIVRAVIQSLGNTNEGEGDKQNVQKQKKQNSNKIEVYYPDHATYGDVEAVYEISSEDAAEPCQAIQCELLFVNHQYKFTTEQQEDDFLDELHHQLTGREFNAFFCGKNERGVLQILAQFKDGDLDIRQTINTYLLEKGFTSSVEVPGGCDVQDDVLYYEQLAVQRRAGIWK